MLTSTNGLPTSRIWKIMICNGDIQTILNSVFPLSSRLRQKSFLLYDSKGDGFIVNYDIPNQSRNIAFIIHGWWGNANSPIIKRYSLLLKKKGFGIILINLKDHTDNYSHCKSIFSFGDINYIEDIIEEFRLKCEKTILIGFSFGGNLALRLNNINKFSSIILVSPVFDINSAFDYIEKKWIYRMVLKMIWKAYLKKKQSVFPQEYDFQRSLKGETIYEIVDGFISYIGYDTVEQYYINNSIMDSHIENLKTPTLIIHAQNDPIIQLSNLYSLKDALKANKFIHMYIYKHGGHCPYAKESITKWLEYLRFFL